MWRCGNVVGDEPVIGSADECSCTFGRVQQRIWCGSPVQWCTWDWRLISSCPYWLQTQGNSFPLVPCTPWAIKNVALYFCPYFHQLMTDFYNSFTGTLCRQFALMWLLYIPTHRKCVFTLPCEMWMKYAYIMIITNKHFDKIEKNTSDQHCGEWSVWHYAVWV